MSEEYSVLYLPKDVAIALIEKSHARLDARLEKVNVIRCQLGRHGWNIHVSEHAIYHLPSTTSACPLASFTLILITLHINLNGSRRTALRATNTHSRHSQLHSRHGWSPLPQLFVWLEPYRSAWPGKLPGVSRREERPEEQRTRLDYR